MQDRRWADVTAPLQEEHGHKVVPFTLFVEVKVVSSQSELNAAAVAFFEFAEKAHKRNPQGAQAARSCLGADCSFVRACLVVLAMFVSHTPMNVKQLGSRKPTGRWVKRLVDILADKSNAWFKIWDGADPKALGMPEDFRQLPLQSWAVDAVLDATSNLSGLLAMDR